MTALPTLLAELRRLASLASPGPWKWDGSVWDYDPENEAPWLIDGDDSHPPVLGGEIKCGKEHDARFIAAANPTTILSLLAHIDAIESKLGDRLIEIAQQSERIEALEKRVGTLDSLLTELYALVVGECPSLLNEDSGGSERLDAEICAALAEQGEPK